MNASLRATTPLARAYATIAPASRKAPLPDPSRVFTARKAQLHAEYGRILAANDVVLLLRHSNFTEAGFDKLRKGISAAVPKKSTLPSSSSLLPPSFQVIRPGVFAASLRARFPEHTVDSVKSLLGGSFAVLTCQTLDPPQLTQVVRIIDRAVPSRAALAAAAAKPPPRKPVSADDIEEEVPREKEPPAIELVGALIEDRLFLVDGIKEIGRLPTLDTLHAQIVGLLSAPGAKLAQLLSSASGGSLLRTLQGFEKGLEEAQESKW